MYLFYQVPIVFLIVFSFCTLSVTPLQVLLFFFFTPLNHLFKLYDNPRRRARCPPRRSRNGKQLAKSPELVPSRRRIQTRVFCIQRLTLNHPPACDICYMVCLPLLHMAPSLHESCGFSIFFWDSLSLRTVNGSQGSPRLKPGS